MFLRNYWYVAASAPEIGRKPFRRIIMNEPVVFYRTEDGTPVALEDRCPHRRLPLSMGRLVENDVLQCHYHGLRFDRTGACVRVPGQDMIPATARVKSYPVAERYKWLWIWMGDPALADPSKITDYHWLDDPDWGAKTDYLYAQCNWQLVNDNLLDLKPHNAEMTERVFQQIKTAFLEDVSVFTMQQTNIGLDPDAPQVDINADSGGIQARRINDRLYQDEQATMNAAKTAAE